MNKYYCMYQITNLINGKIYIGIHTTNNLNDSYIGSGKLIRAAVKKYGRNQFKKEILATFASEEEMIAKEIEVVTEEFCARDDTYNVMPGGKFGSKARNGLTFAGKHHSSEAKEKISKKSIGRVPSDNTRRKLSENNFARTNPFKQRKHAKLAPSGPKSEEHKEKIRQSALLTKSGSKNKGVPKPTTTCPHCGKVGSVNTMSRWHFSNCKSSPIA